MILRRKAWAATLTLLMILLRAFRFHPITCHPTEYKIGSECCPMCPPGSRVKTDCTEFRSTSCLPCTDGTYMDQPNGLKKCSPCSTCYSGAGLMVKEQCTRLADTSCEPMEGFFCTDPKRGNCGVAQKHSSCEPGQYISKIGTAITDTLCSDCISGTFSNGTMLSCQPHRQCEKEKLQLIKAGTASTDVECGKKSSNITGSVIGIVVVFLVVATIVVVLWKYQKITIPGICRKRQKNPRGNTEEAAHTSLRQLGKVEH
ncbi:tumor necrosis factor receptor superfamily member 14-like [Anableps anableps]